MARVQSYPVSIPSGKVVIFDPLLYLELEAENSVCRNNVVMFESPYITKDGTYKVYSDGDRYFVDIHPRILRVKTRPDLRLINGYVSVDCCSIGFADVQLGGFGNLSNSKNHGVVTFEVEPGEYSVWFEQSGDNYFHGVIGFGKSPSMILNGIYAEQVAEVEKKAVSIFRREAGWMEVKADVEAEIISLHIKGCKDKIWWTHPSRQNSV